MSMLAAAAPVSFILTADRTAAKPFHAGALGLAIIGEDDFAVTFALSGGVQVAWFTDPDGNVLSLTQFG